MSFSRKMRFMFRKLTLKRLCYLTVILFLTSYVISSFCFLFINSMDFMYSFYEYLPDDVSCYFDKNFKKAFDNQDMNMSFADEVFMFYTSCHLNLKPAYLCAIEAASVAYPTKKVNVVLNKPLSFCSCQETVISKILYYGNVHFVEVQIEEILETTPFKNIIGRFENSSLNRGMRKYKKVENMMKLATLYNHGGRIIDMDLIVTDPIYDGDKWLILENNDIVSSAAMAFDQNMDEIVKKSIELLPILQDLKDDELNISQAITHALRTLCYNTSNTVRNVLTKTKCKELQLHRLKIHTVKYSDPVKPLPQAYAYRVLDEPKLYHIRNNSLLTEIAKKYCPITYNFFFVLEKKDSVRGWSGNSQSM